MKPLFDHSTSRCDFDLPICILNENIQKRPGFDFRTSEGFPILNHETKLLEFAIAQFELRDRHLHAQYENI